MSDRMKRLNESDKDRISDSAAIERQLARILNSDVFAVHTKLKDLLAALVEAEINNKPISEDDLGVQLFDKPPGWLPLRESAVRERKRLMKKELMSYYTTEGKYDPILIEFPNRGNVNIRRNPLAEATALVASAQQRMSESCPVLTGTYPLKTVKMLQDCIDQYPSYAPAYAELASVLLIYTACDLEKDFPVRKSIARAEKAAAKAVELDSTLWSGHIATAALRCCRFDVQGAMESFTNALAIDFEKTQRSVFYIAYLEWQGKSDEADRCLLLRSASIDGARNNYLLLALFSYLRGDAEGYSVLVEGSVNGRYLEIDDRYKQGELILKFDAWPAYAIAALFFLESEHSGLAVKYAEATVYESNGGAFPGLPLLAYSVHGREKSQFTELAKEWLEKIKGGHFRPAFSEPEDPIPITAFSMGMAHLGLRNLDLAEQKFSLACDEGYPWMFLLLRGPMFEELKSRPVFEALLSRVSAD